MVKSKLWRQRDPHLNPSFISYLLCDSQFSNVNNRDKEIIADPNSSSISSPLCNMCLGRNDPTSSFRSGLCLVSPSLYSHSLSQWWGKGCTDNSCLCLKLSLSCFRSLVLGGCPSPWMWMRKHVGLLTGWQHFVIVREMNLMTDPTCGEQKWGN